MLDKVQKIVGTIPSGRVTTYGEIGRVLRIHPRQVGRLLHQNTDPAKYPCHRVVKSDGRVASGYAFGGKEAQIAKLKAEGVRFEEDGIADFPSSFFRIKAID